MPYDMPSPKDRSRFSVFTHNETVDGHPLVWVTYTTATHVGIMLPLGGDKEEWVANAFHMGHARWPAFLRINYHHAAWLGKDEGDPTGYQNRVTLLRIAKDLWNKAHYK